MDTEQDLRQSQPDRGQLLFVAAFLMLSLLLLSQIGDQTVWKRKTMLAAQPRFWPAVGLGGMVLFSALHLFMQGRFRLHASDWAETAIWLRTVEFAIWFLVYVQAVPYLGYLPTTVLFVVLMLWRMGYRSRRIFGWGAGFAIGIVVLFKSLLQVKIPGGAIYEYLPDVARNFFILNF